MSLFSFFKSPSMDEGILDYQTTPNGVLIDVRTPSEYAQGHVSGSRNIPLDIINTAPNEIPDKNTPLFVHCHSGARSGQAVSLLQRMGYRNVKNIGGLQSYRGKVER